MRIATLRKLVTVFGYAWAITFLGGVALLLLCAILWEPLLGTPWEYEYDQEFQKVIMYVAFPLLGLAIACQLLAEFLNNRRLNKFLAKASSEEMAFYKMMQDDGYEITDADKFIKAASDTPQARSQAGRNAPGRSRSQRVSRPRSRVGPRCPRAHARSRRASLRPE